jgi:PAS domain S-box-containing protein
MTNNDPSKLVRTDAPSEETLRVEKEALSNQVKRLIRAEGKLYEYQEELDAQLKEYKALYELNRRLNGTFNIGKIFQETVDYVIQQLGFERAVLFRKEEDTGNYAVCSLDGYYDLAEKTLVSELTIDKDDGCLFPLTAAGKEYLICKAGSKQKELEELRARLHMDEYFVYPLRYYALPHAFLAVGNSADNAVYYRRVDDSPGARLSMGNLIGLVSSLIENHITYDEMEKARKQERLAEVKYRGIFENAADGIFQRTPDGKYLDANPAMARMLGYASVKELMTEVTDIDRQLYADPKCHADLMDLLATHGAVEGFEARFYRKDRSVIWVSFSMRTVRDGAGQVLFYEGMVDEITERKRSEEALRESERKFRELSEALEQRVKESVDELRRKDKILIVQGRQAVMGEMLNNIAHQWRQPLNMLALLAQELQMTKKRGDLSEEFIDANIGGTLEIISRMSKTIDDFRYFFRQDKEKVEFRVLETLEKTLSILEGSFQIHGIRTEVVQTGEPVIIGYPTEFVQVLLNILINARDALIARHADMPRVSIKVLSQGGKTVVIIADNAGGIPDEIMDKIFEPYFSTKGPEQGTGIGLFMSKIIIEKNMNGLLTVRNVGNGAEFRIEV